MQDNWYDSNRSQENEWYAPNLNPGLATPGARPSAPVHRPWRTISLIVLLGLVLAAVLLLLFPRTPAVLPPLPGSSSAEPFEFDPTDPDNFDDDDFRAYFDGIYKPFEKADECSIPMVESYDSSVTIELQPQGTEPLSYQEIYRQCSPFVAAIHAYADPEDETHYFWGTGVVMTEDGYIVTNAHIVEGTSRATVTLWDDSEYEALLVGCDSRSDIAVLKIEAEGLTPARFSVSDSMQVGDTVIAIGNPLGEEFRSTMTEGIVSGIDRDISHNGTTFTLIQTSAPINEGNSGGPLINIYGQVVGITNMKMSANYYGAATIEGVGFAIPSRTVKEMADSILSAGKVSGRPALGLTVGVIPEEAKAHFDLPDGLYVSLVAGGSDCEAKGILAGDILTEVNGQPVSKTEDVLSYVHEGHVGDELELTLCRDGEFYTVRVSLVDVNDVY